MFFLWPAMDITSYCVLWVVQKQTKIHTQKHESPYTLCLLYSVSAHTFALVDSIYENKTEYHRLGGFNKESLFLIGWKSKIKEVAQSGCGGIQAPSFAMVVELGGGTGHFIYLKNTKLSWGFTFTISFKTSYSLKANVQIPINCLGVKASQIWVCGVWRGMYEQDMENTHLIHSNHYHKGPINTSMNILFSLFPPTPTPPNSCKLPLLWRLLWLSNCLCCLWVPNKTVLSKPWYRLHSLPSLCFPAPLSIENIISMLQLQEARRH